MLFVKSLWWCGKAYNIQWSVKLCDILKIAIPMAKWQEGIHSDVTGVYLWETGLWVTVVFFSVSFHTGDRFYFYKWEVKSHGRKDWHIRTVWQQTMNRLLFSSRSLRSMGFLKRTFTKCTRNASGGKCPVQRRLPFPPLPFLATASFRKNPWKVYRETMTYMVLVFFTVTV